MTKPVFLMTDHEYFGTVYGVKWYDNDFKHHYYSMWRGKHPFKRLLVAYVLCSVSPVLCRLWFKVAL